MIQNNGGDQDVRNDASINKIKAQASYDEKGVSQNCRQ
jgi:hypothetical protein